MKIKYTTIIVNNIHESTNFYKENFNLEIIEEYQNPEISMTMLSDGQNVLELIQNNQDAKIDSIGFEVENLDNTIKIFESKKIEFIYKPEKDDDLKFVSLKDPNGLIITISEKK